MSPPQKPKLLISVTFGSLNNSAKLSPAAAEAWGRLLDAVPGSRLLLLGGRTAEGRRRVEGLFGPHAAAGRVEVVGRRPRAEYYALYNRIDVALAPPDM